MAAYRLTKKSSHLATVSDFYLGKLSPPNKISNKVKSAATEGKKRIAA
jgi:hypothetical protein